MPALSLHTHTQGASQSRKEQMQQVKMEKKSLGKFKKEKR